MTLRRIDAGDARLVPDERALRDVLAALTAEPAFADVLR